MTNQPSLTKKNQWRIVFITEISDLWSAGRALLVLFAFSLLMSILSFLLATNSELSLIPAREVVFITLQITIVFGLSISLLYCSNAICGERDRESLEMLLLAPVSRSAIVLGKYLAALSLWFSVFVVSIPYLYILKSDLETFWIAVFWGLVLGSLLSFGTNMISMCVSLVADSSKSSLLGSMILFLLLIIPTQLPGTAQIGSVGVFIKRINPMESTYQFLEKILVNNRTISEMVDWLISPVVFCLIGIVILNLSSNRLLKLHGWFDL